MPETNKPLEMNLWGSKVMLPEGTRVHLVKNADGIKGDMYAVSSVRQLQKLTGNMHDPQYRYCFVDKEHVRELP